MSTKLKHGGDCQQTWNQQHKNRPVEPILHMAVFTTTLLIYSSFFCLFPFFHIYHLKSNFNFEMSYCVCNLWTRLTSIAAGYCINKPRTTMPKSYNVYVHMTVAQYSVHHFHSTVVDKTRQCQRVITCRFIRMILQWKFF